MSRTTKVLALSIGEGINLVLGFLLVPYLARAMSLEDNGTYGQVLLVVTVAVKFLSFGFSKVLFADLADESKSQASSMISNIVLVSLFGLFGLVIVLLLQEQIALHFDNDILQGLILIYAFAIPFMLVKTSINAGLIYFGKVRPTVIVSVVTNILRLAAVFFFIQIHYSLVGVFASLLLVPIIQSLWLSLYLPKGYLNLKAIDCNIIKGQCNDGLPLGLTVTISTLFYSIDGFMVSNMLGTEQFAMFRNGSVNIPIIASLYGAVNTIVLPDVTKLYGQNQIGGIVNLKKKALHNTAGIIYPIVIFFIVFSFILIPLYLSEKYADSFLVFSLFNGALLLRITSYDDIYIASKNNNRLPLKYFIALVCNVISNYVFISLWGINGAAAATLFSFFILIGLLLNGGLKILNVDLCDLIDLNKLFKTLLVPIITSSIIAFIVYYADMPLLILPLGVLYALIVYHYFLKSKILDTQITSFVLTKFLSNKNRIKLFFDKCYL